MLNHYRSPYPNYIHQLFITPSKHLYVLKDKRLKWQSKALEVKLDGIEDVEREHLVHYVLADHTSAAFYAEVGTSKPLVNPADFLTRAWYTVCITRRGRRVFAADRAAQAGVSAADSLDDWFPCFLTPS